MLKKFQKMFFIFLKKYVSENAKNRMFYILEKTEILKKRIFQKCLNKNIYIYIVLWISIHFSYEMRKQTSVSIEGTICPSLASSLAH